MGTLNSWDVVDANNDAAPPDGWPENTMNYSEVNDTGRAVQGTLKRFFADINGSLDAGGVADAYTLTLNETGYSAYFDGMTFACTIPVDNATATPTMDVNGIGPVTIVDNLGGALGIEALIGGGVYTFQHDGTNLRLLTGGIAVNGSTGEFLINQDGRIDAPGNLTYNAGDDIVEAQALRLLSGGELEFDEQADHSATIQAGRGYLWVRDDNPTTLVFTSDDGTDQVLGAGGGGTPALPLNSVQFNNGGSFGGDADLTWNGTTLAVLQDGITAGLSVQGTNVLNGNVVSITGDPTTGRVLLITSTGLGEAIRVSGGNPAIEVVSGGIDILGGASLSLEDGSGSSSIFQNGTTDFVINPGLDAGDMRIQTAEPGSELNINHRDGADLFTRRSADFDAFTVRFYSSGNEIVNINNTDIQLNRRLNIINSGQIQFPATQVPSAVANVLDDYQEEQQFVVTMTPSGSGSITIDASNDELAYVKIGRIVHLQGEISVASVSSPTGEGVDIELPFTSLDAPGIHSQDQLYVSCRVINLSGLSDGFYELFIDRGANTMRIRDIDGSPNLADNFQATTIVSINVTYMADA